MKECNICFEEVTHLKQNNCIMCEFIMCKKCYIRYCYDYKNTRCPHCKNIIIDYKKYKKIELIELKMHILIYSYLLFLLYVFIISSLAYYVSKYSVSIIIPSVVTCNIIAFFITHIILYFLNLTFKLANECLDNL